MKTRRKLSTLILSLCLTMSSLIPSISLPLQAQNPSEKITLEVGQVRELTKKAKFSIILQKQNDELFKQNTQVKQAYIQLKADKEKADAELETLRKRWHYCLMGLVILVVFVVVKIFR